MKAKTRVKVVGYGESELAEVKLAGINISQSANGAVQGMSFRLVLGGSTVPVLVRDAVGKPVASYAAAAAAVGQALGLSTLEITRGLDKFSPPAGRLRLIKGRDSSLILDDTYNSSPQALFSALDILSGFPLTPGAHRWAVLGDMLELGDDSEKLHAAAGQMVSNMKIDFLLTVGEQAKHILAAARMAGFDDNNSWSVGDTAEAATILKKELQSGDVVLVKGSQGVRCERIVKEIMLEPERAGKLLVRQTKPWV